jgi:tripartite ATP-independent transporter DctM subunit
VLFTAVVGSIYGGVATPTEAASIGVCMALIIAALFKSLNIKMLKEAFEGTMRTTAMIMLIVFAAIFLNFVLGMMGITQAMLNFIRDLGLTPVQTVLLIIVFYLFLGMFMETLSMMLTTVPIVFPIVMALGVPEFSDVWFGILITLLMEAALITPPIGVNLYVVHGIRMRGGHFNDVAIGAIPFLIAMLVMILMLVAYPDLATWLPTLVYH